MAQHLDTLALGEVRTNPRGGKTAQVSHQSGKPVVCIATAPLSCPFGAGLYQDDGSSTRLNIDFGQLEGLELIYRGLDEQLIRAAIAAKDSLWSGKGLTDQQIRGTTPPRSRSGKVIPQPCAPRSILRRSGAGAGREQKSRYQTPEPKAA